MQICNRTWTILFSNSDLCCERAVPCGVTAVPVFADKLLALINLDMRCFQNEEEGITLWGRYVCEPGSVPKSSSSLLLLLLLPLLLFLNSAVTLFY